MLFVKYLLYVLWSQCVSGFASSYYWSRCRLLDDIYQVYIQSFLSTHAMHGRVVVSPWTLASKRGGFRRTFKVLCTPGVLIVALLLIVFIVLKVLDGINSINSAFT